MNIDMVQENTIVEMLNDSYGAGNILSSNVVKIENGRTFEIPFNTPQGVRYARVRPEVVDDYNIDLYISMPRMDVKGVVSEEETAIRIEHGQTGVIGGISGQVAGIGVDNGLVLTLNGSILERMEPEEIKEAYTQSRMDVAMPAGDVYRFEKLLVKADEKLTITMEVRE